MLNKILHGHVLDVLINFPDKFVDMIFTSPPYWTLRAYGTEPQVWGGDNDCKHEFKIYSSKEKIFNFRTSTLAGGDPSKNGFCSKCNAWQGEYGSEPSVQLYMAHTLEIFTELKRVLKDEGCMFINIGDTYAGSCQGAGTKFMTPKQMSNRGTIDLTIGGRRPTAKTEGIPAKSQCAIPERFAVMMIDELQMIKRNTCIWHKPSCMPSSAGDRFTNDFEPVFFFTKKGKYYWERQFEPLSEIYKNDPRHNQPDKEHKSFKDYQGNNVQTPTKLHTNMFGKNLIGRNPRTVWTIPSAQFSEAHFAVFPEKLLELPIKAGCPHSICKECGKAKYKIYETEYITTGNNRGDKNNQRSAGRLNVGNRSYDERKLMINDKYKWVSCSCNAGFRPGIVLDPFMGSGTTAVVARKLGRDFIGIELQQKYIDMANSRLEKELGILFK